MKPETARFLHEFLKSIRFVGFPETARKVGIAELAEQEIRILERSALVTGDEAEAWLEAVVREYRLRDTGEADLTPGSALFIEGRIATPPRNGGAARFLSLSPISVPPIMIGNEEVHLIAAERYDRGFTLQWWSPLGSDLTAGSAASDQNSLAALLRRLRVRTDEGKRNYANAGSSFSVDQFGFFARTHLTPGLGEATPQLAISIDEQTVNVRLD